MTRIPMHPFIFRVAAICAALVAAVPLDTVRAQSLTETKIRLLADALRARDNGDYRTAKKNLEELLVIVPNDPTAKRLLDGVNRELADASTNASDATRASEPEESSLQRPAGGSDLSLPAGVADEVEAMTRNEEQRLLTLIDSAKTAHRRARSMAAGKRYDDAVDLLDRTIAALPSNPMTEDVLKDLRGTRTDVTLAKSRLGRRDGDLSGQSEGSVETTSPGFLAERREIKGMIARGRGQYLAGDIDGAAETFRRVETVDSENVEAKNFLKRIAEHRSRLGVADRQKTRATMLQEVVQGWQRPGVYRDRSHDGTGSASVAPLAQKLGAITIPSVNFSGVDLARVISTLSAISEEYDPDSPAPKGVNIVLIDPANANPRVNISLRNLPLKRVLDFITDSVGYQYDVQPDAVVVRPGGERSMLDTAFFPVSRATVIRMTGSGAVGAPVATAAVNDPFTPSGTAATSTPAPAGESVALQAFLQQAGVNFGGTPGASLVYDGSAMIVTQTSRNIERIRNILNRYNDVRQVEIEAKFLEVQEGALEELGIDWSVGRRAGLEQYTFNGRSLSDAFTSATSGGELRVVRPSVVNPVTGESDQPAPLVEPVVPPQLPGQVDIATGASPLGTISGVIGEFDVSAIVRALSRKSGSDLLSAPKVTVLSGNPARMTVAQELRYPQSYSDIQSEVGRGSSTEAGSSAGVTITAGTPQDFATRNVGVELNVTPTVEEDDYSISLELNPRVTEFEGFVEYGGPSVAISGGTTVTVPSGFFQPIFSTREVTTKVTIWDGATLVMGGLTREEVRKVKDKVPVLGSIPLLGRLFRSEGETSTKRNLLIFVTANLVSPGGSPKKQQLKSVAPSSLYQNPTIVTPSGSEPRPVRDRE